MNKKIITIILIMIFISSCTPKEIIVYTNNTVYVNNTITEYKNITEIKLLNRTVTQIEKCEGKYSQDYVDKIIRDYQRVKYELTFLNRTNLVDNLTDEYHNMNISLSRCETKLEEIEKVLK